MTETLWRGPLTFWREEAGLTLDEAALKLGTTPYLLQVWEARQLGKTPSATILARMCKVYGISRRTAFNEAIVEV